MPGAANYLGKAAVATLSLWVLGTSTALGFSDTQSHWGRTCINQLSQRKLVSGYPDGSFRPNATVNRAEFAILMLNAFPNVPRSRPATAFRDVPTTHWAYRAIREATERQFFSGYPDGTFKPTQAIPRVQAIAIVANAANRPAPDQPEATLQLYFEDASQIPTYARRAIAAGALGGVAVNYPQARQLRPNQSSTRGDVATILCQALNIEQSVPAQYVAGGKSLFVIPPEAGGFPPFSEGFTVARAQGRYGYINTTGQMTIRPQFDAAFPFSEGLAVAGTIPDASGTLWGYINRQGNWIVNPRFSRAFSFSERLAAVEISGKTGFINQAGSVVIQPQFEAALPFKEGLAAIRLDNQWGYIDKTGQRVIALQPYETVASFSEGLARVRLNQQEGFIDKTGKLVISSQFAEARDFSGGLAAVKNAQGQWGYIDKTGKLVIQPQFFQAQSFSEGLAGVLIGDRWGFINQQGAIAIPARFYAPQAQSSTGGMAEPFAGEVVKPFSEGLAMVRLGDKAGYINKTGAFVVEAQFADAEPVSENLARVNVGGRWVSEPSTYTSDGPQSPYLTNLQGGEWGYIRIPKL